MQLIMDVIKLLLKDISKIITLCLRHRLRKDPLESIDSGDKVSKVFKEVFEIED
jgi:magnesium chelatase subunit I